MLRKCSDQNVIGSMLPTIVSGVISWIEMQAAANPAFRFEMQRLLTIVGDLNSDCSEEAGTIRPESETEAVNLANSGDSFNLVSTVVLESQTALNASATESSSASVEENEPTVVSLSPSGVPVVERPRQHVVITDDDLPSVASRLGFKCEAARWAAERQRMMLQGVNRRDEIAPIDQQIIAKAKEMRCYLWMWSPRYAVPHDLALLGAVADYYELLSNVVSITSEVMADSELSRRLRKRCLALLAEAQYSLRQAVLAADGPTDPDQRKLYFWLRGQEPDLSRVSADDLMNYAELLANVQTVADEVRDVQQRKTRFVAQIKKVKYHAKILVAERFVGDHWQKIMETVEEMIADGVPPSNRELREIILPLVNCLPEMDLSPGFERVIAAIDEFLNSRPDDVEADDAAEYSPEVVKVAKLLEGRSAVLIGGICRPQAKHGLEQALCLKGLDWIEVSGVGRAFDIFEAHVSRPNVAVVLLMIRWSKHSFGAVRELCSRYGKPLVWIPAGYNPNQVAHQILCQCGDRLAGTLSPRL